MYEFMQETENGGSCWKNSIDRMKLCQGRVRLGIRKCSSLRGWLGTDAGSPGQWSQHQAAGVQEAFGQHSQSLGFHMRGEEFISVILQVSSNSES